MDVMEARRRILLNTGEFIPPGYQQYDYLQTDSYKSYIDTGVQGADDLQLDFAFTMDNKLNWGPVFGNYDGNRNNNWWGLRQTDNAIRIQFFVNHSSIAQGSDVYFNVDTVIGKQIETHLKKDEAKFIVNGVEYMPTLTAHSATASNKTIYIGNFTTVQSYGCTNKFYNFRIKKGNKLIRNYIPVVRKSDSKAGFYDTVNYTFNPSIGASNFTAGND